MAAHSVYSIRSLPPELRLPIFEAVLVRNSRRDVPPLLQALENDPVLYEEALHVFYRLNVFGLCELSKENQAQSTSPVHCPIPNAADVQKLSINFCSGFTALNSYDFRISLHNYLPGPGEELLASVVNAREVHVCLYLHIDRWVSETPTVPAPIKQLQTLPKLERVVFEWWNAGPVAAQRLVGAWHREFSRTSGVRPRPLRVGNTDSGSWEWVAPKGEVLALQL